MSMTPRAVDLVDVQVCAGLLWPSWFSDVAKPWAWAVHGGWQVLCSGLASHLQGLCSLAGPGGTTPLAGTGTPAQESCHAHLVGSMPRSSWIQCWFGC